MEGRRKNAWGLAVAGFALVVLAFAGYVLWSGRRLVSLAVGVGGTTAATPLASTADVPEGSR
jgi:hypothetical protein